MKFRGKGKRETFKATDNFASFESGGSAKCHRIRGNSTDAYLRVARHNRVPKCDVSVHKKL